ncbi:MAG: hypothetical protein NVS3B21_10030 [Acidimicrobiales bacterium]
MNETKAAEVGAEPSRAEPSRVEPSRVDARWPNWVVGAVMFAAVVGIATFSVLQHQLVSDNVARTQAQIAARERVPVLLTYSYSTLKDDLARSVDQTTGRFQSEYRQLVKDVVERTATQKQVSTKAEVTGVGVVKGDRHKVVVLVFLTQTTTSPGAAPSKVVNRVEVSMEPTDDGWKISSLTPR